MEFRNSEPEEWRQALLQHFSTSEEWIHVSRMERRTLKIDGKGLSAIGTACGTGGRPENSLLDWLRLGEFVYGPQDERIKAAIAFEERKARERVKKDGRS